MTLEQAYHDSNNLNSKQSVNWSGSQNQINGFDQNERLMLVNGLPFDERGAPIPYDNEFKCLVHDFVFHYNFLTVTTDQLLLQID